MKGKGKEAAGGEGRDENKGRGWGATLRQWGRKGEGRKRREGMGIKKEEGGD